MLQQNLCLYCFQPFNGYGPCLHCGHTAGEPRSGAQQLPLGTILDGKYQLGMVLGQGGFGITYLALDLKLQTRVAIKEYFPLGLVTRQAQTVTFSTPNAQPFFQKGVEAFYREAQLLTRFRNHPNIVHVSSFFRQNGTAYFLMEYVEGESLTAYLEKCGGRLSYDETVRLLTPVLDALQVVHSAGILHRDIAPDNIYLAKDGQIKLLDFGAAKNELSMHTHSSAAILKPGYAPMEQYSAGSNQGPWTDIYAMGAVIYRCLTGNVPLDAPDRIIGEPLISFHDAGVDAPAGAEAAISKALALDITDRWQSVTEFKNALIDPSALKNSKIETTGHEKERKPKKPSAKKWLIPVLSVLVVLIIDAGILIKTVLLPEQKYREGIALIETGQYEAGIEVLQEIRTYKDAENQIRRGRSLQAEALLLAEEYEQAQELFTELSGAEYAEQRISAEKSAKGLNITIEPTEEPKTEVTPEPTSVLQPIPTQTELQKRLSKAEVGDIIRFGSYEQDGDEENGPENIEWIVLEKNKDNIFVVSYYGLSWANISGASTDGLTTYYNDGKSASNKETDWLNTIFFANSFNEEEKKIILSSNFEPLRDEKSSSTIKIYLLSAEEVDRFFPSSKERIINGTVKTDIDSKGSSNWWWLRSPNIKNQEIYKCRYNDQCIRTWWSCSYVAYDGELSIAGQDCDARGLLRPAMRINLFSEKTIKTENYSPNDNSIYGTEELSFFSPDIQIGDIIQFGSYEQDGEDSNGKEAINWIIISEENDSLLLFSQYALDWRPYHSKNEETTWEKSDLRRWLNEDFFEIAFTKEQQELILSTEVFTPDTTVGDYYFSDKSSSSDRCFLLSYDEIEKYLDSKNRVLAYHYWIIRSGSLHVRKSRYLSGGQTIIDDNYFVPIINDKGNLQYGSAQSHTLGIRPVIWVRK